MGKYYKGIYNCKEFTTGVNRFEVYEDVGSTPNVNMGIWIQILLAFGVGGVSIFGFYYFTK